MATESTLKKLVDGQLPSPSHMEAVAARDRVLDELRSTPAHLLQPRIAETPQAVSPWRTGLSLAAAAALIVLVATVSLQWSDSLATVEAADGSRYSLDANDVLRSDDGRGTMLTLVDGSRVEMRSQSELSLERADDGIGIRLRTGGLIVDAAKQSSGHLYVHTKDMTVAVAGTVFLVNAENDGSRVAVIEGEVRVQEGKLETRLRPGEQVATSPTLAARPLKEEIAWSRNSSAHLAILEAFQQGIAATTGPRTPLANAPQAAAGGQAPAPVSTQEFEEAAIRPCDPDNLPPTPAGARGGGANSFQMTPGRTYGLCLTLATLVRTAYGYSPAAAINPGGRGLPMRADVVYGLGVEDGLRVRGGPGWVRNDRYTIEAVAGGPADAETMRGPMLRALLERRFKLKVHVEAEQIPAFALVVAPGGLKMKEGICTPADPSAPRLTSTTEMVRRNLEAARRGETTAGPCGYYGTANGPNMLFVGAGAGVPILGNFLGAPVINRTGIPNTVRFNYVFEYAPDESTTGAAGRGLPPEAQLTNDGSVVPRAPNLVTALEEQLGLKLEPARAPREFIVIDQVERPTAN
jgi:uncharacterized protein (TIGR03435 family)